MAHGFLSLFADLAILLLVLFLPVLWIIYTDRFRHTPHPEQLAILLAVVAAVGVLLFIPALAIIAAAALIALGAAWLSAHHALSGLSYERRLQPGRLFVGDEADLILQLDNRKLLPLAWLSISDPIHYSTVRGDRDVSDLLRFSGGVEVQEDLRHALVNRTAVGSYQKVIRTYRVRGLQRGVYTLGPARVSSGDPFGLFQHDVTLGERQEILVYPRIYAPDEIDLPFQSATGEVVARRSLFEDPTLIAGSRQYQPDDPLRLVHWKATARTGELQVRISDSSTTAQLRLVLNLNTFQHVWQGVDQDRMEAAISVAASLALHWLDQGFAVGLRSNGIIPGHSGQAAGSYVPSSAHPRQGVLLLEHLARVNFSGRLAPEDMLQDEVRRLPYGASIIFVTPILTPELISLLTSRRLIGRVSLVYCGRHAAPVVRGLPIHLITPPADIEHAVS